MTKHADKANGVKYYAFERKVDNLIINIFNLIISDTDEHVSMMFS